MPESEETRPPSGDEIDAAAIAIMRWAGGKHPEQYDEPARAALEAAAATAELSDDEKQMMADHAAQQIDETKPAAALRQPREGAEEMSELRKRIMARQEAAEITPEKAAAALVELLSDDADEDGHEWDEAGFCALHAKYCPDEPPTDSGPMVAVNVRIPESLLARLDAEADRCLISRRVVVEQAVRGLLDALDETDG